MWSARFLLQKVRAAAALAKVRFTQSRSAPGCLSSQPRRRLVSRTISLKGSDIKPSQVASELTELLAKDVLARMDSVGTVPRLVDGRLDRRLLVIYNPHSGKNKAGKVSWRGFSPLCAAKGHSACLVSKHARHTPNGEIWIDFMFCSCLRRVYNRYWSSPVYRLRSAPHNLLGTRSSWARAMTQHSLKASCSSGTLVCV